MRALDFGLWDGGMVTPALKAHFKSAGVQMILETKELKSCIYFDFSEQIQCLVGNWLSPPVKCLRAKNTCCVRLEEIAAHL